MNDVLSVNEKYRNVWRDKCEEEVNTHTHRHTCTHSFDLSQGFCLACSELSCSDKNNGFGAMARGGPTSPTEVQPLLLCLLYLWLTIQLRSAHFRDRDMMVLRTAADFSDSCP